MHTAATSERMIVSIDFFLFIADRIVFTCSGFNRSIAEMRYKEAYPTKKKVKSKGSLQNKRKESSLYRG